MRTGDFHRHTVGHDRYDDVGQTLAGDDDCCSTHHATHTDSQTERHRPVRHRQ